jgi:PhnB protein
MTVRLSPYLSFRDDARAAMEFYQSVLGGKLTLNTFAEQHMSEDPDDGEKIMHGMLETDSGITLMGADTPTGMEHTPNTGVSISLSGDDEAALRDYWDGLSGAGTVVVPLERAPWGDTFGMCVDRFGTNWMINASGQSG